MIITIDDYAELRAHLDRILCFCNDEIKRLRRDPSERAKILLLKGLVRDVSKVGGRYPCSRETVQAFEDRAGPLIGAARREHAEDEAHFEALPWVADPAEAFVDLPPEGELRSAELPPDPGGPNHGYGDPPELGGLEYVWYLSEWEAIGGLQDGLVWLASSQEARTAIRPTTTTTTLPVAVHGGQ
jgi:hypothetical protein